ncbi:MAG: hypothetical protein AAB270_03235, partial [Chloroflexota bacterium]
SSATLPTSLRVAETELGAAPQLSAEVADELRGLLRSYITYLLEGDMASARFLDSVRQPPVKSALP